MGKNSAGYGEWDSRYRKFPELLTEKDHSSRRQAPLQNCPPSGPFSISLSYWEMDHSVSA
jgi:hypothetical protein